MSDQRLDIRAIAHEASGGFDENAVWVDCRDLAQRGS